MKPGSGAYSFNLNHQYCVSCCVAKQCVTCSIVTGLGASDLELYIHPYTSVYTVCQIVAGVLLGCCLISDVDEHSTCAIWMDAGGWLSLRGCHECEWEIRTHARRRAAWVFARDAELGKKSCAWLPHTLVLDKGCGRLRTMPACSETHMRNNNFEEQGLRMNMQL